MEVLSDKEVIEREELYLVMIQTQLALGMLT